MILRQKAMQLLLKSRTATEEPASLGEVLEREVMLFKGFNKPHSPLSQQPISGFLPFSLENIL